MTVINGQIANQTTFNNAFMSRTANTSAVGEVQLANVDSANGSTVNSVQKELNAIASYAGNSLNAAKTAKPAWTSTAVGASGDNLTQRAEALTVKFGTGELVTSSNQSFTGVKTFEEIKITEAISLAESEASGAGTLTIPSPTTPIVTVTSVTLDAIAGITAPSPEKSQLLILLNGSGATVPVLNESGSASNAIDRILTGTEEDLDLANGGSVLLFYNASYNRWTIVGGSGGGGLSARVPIANLNFYGKDGQSPVLSYDGTGARIWEFEKASEQHAIAGFRVSAAYEVGSQLSLRGRMKSSTGTGNVKLKADMTLKRGSTSETVTFSGSAALTTNDSNFAFTITTSDGRLNDYSFAEADFIVVDFYRDTAASTDTLSGKMMLFTDSLEVSLT